MFTCVNENFATATIEGALMLVGDSIDLEVVQTAAFEAGMDILPPGIRRTKICMSHFEEMVAAIWLRLCVICYSHSTGEG
jgi:hypothetical protein